MTDVPMVPFCASPLAKYRGFTTMTDEVFDIMPMPIIAVSAEGGIEYMNTAARDLLGVRAGVTPRDIWRFVVDELSRNKLREQLGKRVKHESGEYEITLHRLTESPAQWAKSCPLFVRVSSVPLEDEHGIVGGGLGIIRDVTIERATAAIIGATQRAETWTNVLKALATELRKVITFDIMSMSLLDEEESRSRILYRCDHDLNQLDFQQTFLI